MKKFYVIYIFSSLFLFNCSNNVGNLAFEPEQEIKHSIFIAEIGTFTFKQQLNHNVQPKNITTSLKVTTDNTISNETVNYEIIGFKSSIWSFDKIIFIARDTIRINQSKFKLINSESGVLINDENVYISTFNSSDSTNISGHYEGSGKLLSVSSSDPKEFNVEEIFNFYGNINSYNQLILLPLERTSSFDYVSGSYLIAGDFTGNIFKDGVLIGTIDNMSSEPYIFEKPTFNDTLNLIINNVEKRLVIAMQNQTK